MIVSYILQCVYKQLSTELYELQSFFFICLNEHLVIQISIYIDNTLQSQYHWF